MTPDAAVLALLDAVGHRQDVGAVLEHLRMVLLLLLVVVVGVVAAGEWSLIEQHLLALHTCQKRWHIIFDDKNLRLMHS